jgi:hypothetical protein
LCAHYHAEKANDIKEEINILSQTFERVLDRKQAVVQSLMQDLMEAEQQDYMASQSHVYSLDKLLLFQQKRLEEVCAPLFRRAARPCTCLAPLGVQRGAASAEGRVLV